MTMVMIIITMMVIVMTFSRVIMKSYTILNILAKICRSRRRSIITLVFGTCV